MFAAHGYDGAIFCNCLFYKLAPALYGAQVIRKYLHTGKSTSCRIITYRWGRFTKSTDLAVSKATYHALQPDDSLNIIVMQGRLGIPWYYLEIKQPGQPPCTQ